MAATGASELVSHVSRQMPHLTMECLHFILEGNRAGEVGADTSEIRNANALLMTVKSLRSTPRSVPAAGDTVEQLDYGLKDIQKVGCRWPVIRQADFPAPPGDAD